jgi:hypothetical protein
MNRDMYKPVQIQHGHAFYECQKCFALVRDDVAHARWHVSAGGYSADDRDRWREEIRQAKLTMSREEFEQWLNRRVNSVG